MDPEQLIAQFSTIEKSELSKFGLSPHAPYTASETLVRRAIEIAGREHLLLTTHVAESEEEMLMFRDGKGPLFELLLELGRPMSDCGRETPLAFALRRCHFNSDWIVAHLNELANTDFDLLADSEKFHVVHCPRSHRYFGHAPFQLRRLQALGFNVCLGTDSLASNTTLSLLDEMRELRNNELSLTAGELVEMVTLNPARALHHETKMGRIGRGFFADMIAVPCRESGDLFEQIVAHDQPVEWIMVDGQMR
jgi:cytosine/adenosine deaminase-related metal-dependent hydrolase